MSVVNLPSKLNKKQVLQQSNCNLDVVPNKGEDLKMFVRSEDDFSYETENRCSPQKILEKTLKSDAKKLRSIRLDLSSLKRGVIRKAANGFESPNDFSSEDSSEEDIRKKQKLRPVVPNYVTNSDSPPCRKPRQNRQEAVIVSSQNSAKLAKIQPLSIARRNARERNRVKQVNEGFATLRNRIPDYISEAYNEEKGRKSAKKLSKVETLRMAVDYIRHLETLLDLRSNDEVGRIHEVKMECQPWDTPNSSGDYPSPVELKYQGSSPGTFYDQAFEYQERIFYDYDLDFASSKDSDSPDKRSHLFVGVDKSQCVDDFKYYETFNRLKKENGEKENSESIREESLESLEISEKEQEIDSSPGSAKDVMRTGSKKTVLPSITESFNKGIPVFF